MTRLFYPSTAEAVTCRRCGNSTPMDAETCPHCGADHGGMIKSGNASALPPGLGTPFVAARANARAASGPVMSPYPSMQEPSDLVGSTEQRWDRSKTITLAALLLAFVVGGVVYLEHGASTAETGAETSTDTDTSAEPQAVEGQAVSGSIDQAKLALDAAAAAVAAASNNSGAVQSVQPSPAAKAVPVAPAPVEARAPARAPESPAAGTVPAYLQPGVIDNLQAARDAIDRGDLTTARRRFSKIPSAAYESGNVQRTQADLVRAEHFRDDKMQAARDCEATGSWTCVRQNARDVLAVDASNAEAQNMVEQAIERSGWLNGSGSAAKAAAPAPAPAMGSHIAVPPPAAPSPYTSAPAPTGYAAATAATERLLPRYGTAPIVRNPATMGAPVASDQSRVGTGSHVPLTSSYAPHLPPPFVPPVVSTGPGPAAVTQRELTTPSAPSIAPVAVSTQPAPEVSATPSARADAPNAVNTPQSAPVKPTTFVGATPEDEERAIRENGWKRPEAPKPAAAAPAPVTAPAPAPAPAAQTTESATESE